jgi:hypothetical protein
MNILLLDFIRILLFSTLMLIIYSDYGKTILYDFVKVK